MFAHVNYTPDFSERESTRTRSTLMGDNLCHRCSWRFPLLVYSPLASCTSCEEDAVDRSSLSVISGMNQTQNLPLPQQQQQHQQVTVNLKISKLKAMRLILHLVRSLGSIRKSVEV